MPNCSSFGALQENMFKVAGVPMVENCIAGYNSCMFAYGQVSYRFHLLLQILNFFGCQLSQIVHHSLFTFQRLVSASSRLAVEKHIQCLVI